MNPVKSIGQRSNPITLTDLLVVIALIGMLAFLLLPTGDGGNRVPARINTARIDISGLAAAIQQYEITYNRLPVILSNNNEDVTLGIDWTAIEGDRRLAESPSVTSNSKVITILMDIEARVNAGHARDPGQHVFLTPKMGKDKTCGGVSTEDFQFRDPWGNPYIISLDANYDGYVRDAFYGNPAVSAAKSGLVSHNGCYELNRSVMVWSRGPDGKADMTIPANVGVNKDNICSWLM